MGPRRKVSHPVTFRDVLQAICNLRDLRGSTIKKIVHQVQAGITRATKPRNVVMQVQRVLRDGVESGYFKHRAGKYMIAMEENYGPPCDRDNCGKSKNGKCKVAKGKKCVPPKRARKPPTIKRKPCKRVKMDRKKSV